MTSRGAFVSLGLARGNADDVLLFALHGAAGHVAVRTKARYLAVAAAGEAALTSAAIPPLALWHTAAGLWRHRALVRARLRRKTG